VNIPGSSVFGTLFDDLITFRQSLETNAPHSQLQQGISFMDSALDRVLAARATVGSRTARLEATRYQSESTDLTLQSLQSNIEHVDIAEAIVHLNAQQNALQATLGAIGRASTMTLLDFLR
jgi:flagellar hook-associated protein 3 FlgL